MLSTLKKINFLITKRQRKGLVILTLLLFVGMILEVFGLGILIPALSILLDPDMVEKIPLISSLKEFFPDYSHNNFVFLFLGTIVVVYLFKSLFLVFLAHKQNRFLTNITAYISNNLFSSYLKQPYSFHLNRNASELIKNIQVEINYLYVFLLSLITIFIEGGFVLSVLATIIYIEPVGALSIGIFYGFLSVLFLQFTKRKLKEWGKLRQELDAQVSKIALEGLGGIKDILILGKAPFFIELYSSKNYSKARINAKQATVSQIPRFYLELISIFGLVSFIIMLVLQGKDATSLITVLGVFVAATFRMIPSLNRIIAAVQSMKYYRPSVDVIYNEIKSYTTTEDPQKEVVNFKFQKNIEFKNLSFDFKEEIEILKESNLEIKKGQTIGVIGESGSGKSTFVDLLIGLHKPTAGEIIIDGVSGFQINPAWRNKIGYVSQTIFLTDDSIKNNIAFGIPEKEVDSIRILELLKQVQLEVFINSLENGFNTRVGERGVQLSGGQRQRIGIARALYHNPDILILDEATSALDSATEKEVMKSISNLKGQKTIIIIAHRLTTLVDCNFVYEVKNKELNLVKQV
jgi:ABC-type bacteriocin/lantibiotic exporter with double-glycine peptidase domain